MSDIQDRIGEWHRATFGDLNIVERIICKLAEEVDEFLMEYEPRREEAADVVIVLMAYADRVGFDLLAEVESKFATVQARDDQVQRDKERGIE